MHRTLFLAMALASSTSAFAQEPYLATESPSPDALGYLGSYGRALAGLGDSSGSGQTDIVVGEPGAFQQRVWLRDGRSGAVLAQLEAPGVPKSNDNYGYAVAAVLDVTGDGRDDFLVGSHGRLVPGGGASGRVYLYSRPAAGGTPQLLHEFAPQAGTNNWDFGRDVAGIEDVDGDGFGDVLIGQKGHVYSSVPYPGRAYLYSGKTGTLLQTFNYPGTLNSRYGFGEHVAAIPDVDGDGLDDVVVNADLVKLGTNENDSVFVFSSATGLLIQAIQPPVSFPHTGFGDSIAGIEDLNGDGRGEVVIGQSGGPGRVYVYSAIDGVLLGTLKSLASDGVLDKRFGRSVSAGADVDGDGTSDILVGASGEVYEGFQKGRAYAFSGADFSLLSVLAVPLDYEPDVEWDYFLGADVAIIPDANGDGSGEYLVGAPTMGVDGTAWGATFTYFCSTEVEAEVSVRAGVPANPIAMGSNGKPVIGALWQVQIGHAAFAPTAIADVILVSPFAVNQPSPGGTLLVDAAHLLFLRVGVPGAIFDFPIPADCALVGQTISVQGASYDGLGFLGTNALDVLVGSQ